MAYSTDPDAPVLGRLGSLETRLARNPDEIAAAQKLRYQVFREEMQNRPGTGPLHYHMDSDQFDQFCDHLLVLDDDKIVGTYRLLTEDRAADAGGFYSQSEFNLSAVLSANKDLRFLELGRSCISASHRQKRTMELLWHGTWSYALQHKTDVMFGCASFSGTNPSEFSEALAWLWENARLPKHEDCPAKSGNKVELNSFENGPVNNKRALVSLPPMLKGYLRLGAKVSREAVMDFEFGTTDVLVVLKVSDINPRYIAHYGADASRYAE